jgi:hypothetical protein
VKTPRIVRPSLGTIACANCTAWNDWGLERVGVEALDGSLLIVRKPVGQCRASPPTIGRNSVGITDATWPTVMSDHRCRSFELRDHQGRAA